MAMAMQAHALMFTGVTWRPLCLGFQSVRGEGFHQQLLTFRLVY
jgi:hypothetical protein